MDKEDKAKTLETAKKEAEEDETTFFPAPQAPQHKITKALHDPDRLLARDLELFYQPVEGSFLEKLYKEWAARLAWRSDRQKIIVPGVNKYVYSGNGLSTLDLYIDDEARRAKENTMSREELIAQLQRKMLEPASVSMRVQKKLALIDAFVCPQYGSLPRELWASRVGDGICDCCDCSDERRNGRLFSRTLSDSEDGKRRTDTETDARPIKNTCASQGKEVERILSETHQRFFSSRTTSSLVETEEDEKALMYPQLDAATISRNARALAVVTGDEEVDPRRVCQRELRRVTNGVARELQLEPPVATAEAAALTEEEAVEIRKDTDGLNSLAIERLEHLQAAIENQERRVSSLMKEEKKHKDKIQGSQDVGKAKNPVGVEDGSFTQEEGKGKEQDSPAIAKRRKKIIEYLEKAEKKVKARFSWLRDAPAITLKEIEPLFCVSSSSPSSASSSPSSRQDKSGIVAGADQSATIVGYGEDGKPILIYGSDQGTMPAASAGKQRDSSSSHTSSQVLAGFVQSDCADVAITCTSLCNANNGRSAGTGETICATGKKLTRAEPRPSFHMLPPQEAKLMEFHHRLRGDRCLVVGDQDERERQLLDLRERFVSLWDDRMRFVRLADLKKTIANLWTDEVKGIDGRLLSLLVGSSLCLAKIIDQYMATTSGSQQWVLYRYRICFDGHVTQEELLAKTESRVTVRGDQQTRKGVLDRHRSSSTRDSQTSHIVKKSILLGRVPAVEEAAQLMMTYDGLEQRVPFTGQGGRHLPGLLYTQGQDCPGIGPRSAKVVFTCGPGLELVDVREVRTCVYQFEVQTPGGCGTQLRFLGFPMNQPSVEMNARGPYDIFRHVANLDRLSREAIVPDHLVPLPEAEDRLVPSRFEEQPTEDVEVVGLDRATVTTRATSSSHLHLVHPTRTTTTTSSPSTTSWPDMEFLATHRILAYDPRGDGYNYVTWIDTVERWQTKWKEFVSFIPFLR
ncbi:unnamed protein product [Amoebophrya sp. A25]|nr:unnamed protein product [Amoebophrya sp. A25]|eukprot:GSA25T00012674001.1